MKHLLDVPVDITFCEGALKKHPEKLALGSKAVIVAGRSSGQKSGALADVQAALSGQGIPFEVYACIGNNPNVEQALEVAQSARRSGADFVVGVGGGSPLDAAKAVAIFAAGSVAIPELFKNEYSAALPIAAVPTTSGTGSEVTPWSILTWDERRTKLSFGGELTFPRVALLDPGYTGSLPLSITLDTAIDAFTHCLESVVATKATPKTDEVNFKALKLFGSCMGALKAGDVAPIRAQLMEVSLLGGSTIARTGTTMMHAMGYPLTYFHGIPHGRANAMVMPAYLEEVAQHRGARLALALGALGCSRQELTAFVKGLFPITISPTAEELLLWAGQTAARGVEKTTGVPGGAEYMGRVYRRVFGI